MDGSLKVKDASLKVKATVSTIQSVHKPRTNCGGIRNGGGRGMLNMRANVLEKSVDELEKELEDYLYKSSAAESMSIVITLSRVVIAEIVRGW
ncbi:hypothetical protein Tco_1398656 [Tanacetum coccineum]